MWRPGKRALWSGILGFVIAFIAAMFLTEGGRNFVFGLSGWGAPSAIPWVVKSLGAGVIVGSIACFIGGENIFREIPSIEFDFAVPSPGALSLLGIAGLIAGRRRRR